MMLYLLLLSAASTPTVTQTISGRPTTSCHTDLSGSDAAGGLSTTVTETITATVQHTDDLCGQFTVRAEKPGCWKTNTIDYKS